MPSTATNTILGSQTRQMQRREFHAIHPVNHPAGSFTTEQKSALAKGISRGIKDWKVGRRWFRSPAATTLRSFGLSDEQIAERLGVQPKSLEWQLLRHGMHKAAS
jgi:hypothetical protein